MACSCIDGCAFLQLRIKSLPYKGQAQGERNLALPNFECQISCAIAKFYPEPLSSKLEPKTFKSEFLCNNSSNSQAKFIAHRSSVMLQRYCCIISWSGEDKIATLEAHSHI